MENETMSLHELKLWMSGFASALEKMTGKNPLNNEQWQMVLEKIMAAQDASTAK